jgi:hypothetical protein
LPSSSGVKSRPSSKEALLHSIILQEIEIFITTDVKTLSPTKITTARKQSA